MVRQYEPGREDHEFDPRLGSFLLSIIVDFHFALPNSCALFILILVGARFLITIYMYSVLLLSNTTLLFVSIVELEMNTLVIGDEYT